MTQRISLIFKRLIGINPFQGDSKPSRVNIFVSKSKRPSSPFPHPWNYKEPIRILESIYSDIEAEVGSARNNRYIDAPPFAPVLVTRDPGIIRSILLKSSDKPGDFDRDTSPARGIARATGEDTLLYANGPLWKAQKRMAAAPFGKVNLFQPEKFHEFEATFRQTIADRIDILERHLKDTGAQSIQIQLEPEIKAVMLEMLVNNFFGAKLPYKDIREVYVPALERVLDHIVIDTLMNRVWIPIKRMPAVTSKIRNLKKDYALFEKLTDLVLEQRHKGGGLWSQFKSDVPDEKLRSNLRVFLAGALEATTSYACWALQHLSHDSEAQEAVYEEVKSIEEYTPEALKGAKQLNMVLEETLRLTPSLYFLPRRATVDTWVTTDDARKMFIPRGTHILLDVWHSNRLEEFWGVERTGYPAMDFAPQRWSKISEMGHDPQDFMHFGFGYGPRACPGKYLGQLEVALVVGAIVKRFTFKAINKEKRARAGVSTKPSDGVLVDLQLRPL
jgi:cytochrome P450